MYRCGFFYCRENHNMKRIRIFFADHWLEAGLGLVLALAPVLRFSWDLWAQTILHCVALLLLAVFLLLYRPSLSFFSLSIAGFFAAALATMFMSSNRAVTRNELMVLFDALVFCWLFAQLPEGKKRALLRIPCLAGVWLSVILLYYFVQSPLHYFSYSNLQTEAIVNLNVIAGYLLLALGTSFIFIEPDDNRSLIMPVILAAGIVFTGSRGALLAGGAETAIFFALDRKSRGRSFLSGLLIVILLLVLITLNKTRAHTPISFFITDRLDWWRTALSAFLASPLLGHGWGGFGGFSSVYKIRPGLNSLYCHNLILQVAAESGLAGLAAISVFLFAAFSRTLRRLLSGQRIMLPVLLALTGFLAQNLFDYSFYIPGVMILFFVLCAFSCQASSQRRPLNVTALIVTIAVVAGVIVLAVQPLRASRNYQHATYLFKAGHETEADRFLATATRLDPLDPQIYAARAEIAFSVYTRTKDDSFIAQAVDYQKKAVELFDTDASLWGDLAWLMTVRGDEQGALSAVSQAIKLDRFNERYKGIQRAIIAGHPDEDL